MSFPRTIQWYIPHAGLIWPDGPVNIKKLSWYLGWWCVWRMYLSPASTFFLQLANVHMFNDDIYSTFHLLSGYFLRVRRKKKFRKPFWFMSSSHSSRGDPCIVLSRNKFAEISRRNLAKHVVSTQKSPVQTEIMKQLFLYFSVSDK